MSDGLLEVPLDPSNHKVCLMRRSLVHDNTIFKIKNEMLHDWAVFNQELVGVGEIRAKRLSSDVVISSSIGTTP